MTYRVFTVHIESDMTDEDSREAMRRAAEFMVEDIDQMHALEIAENGLSFTAYEFDVDDELAVLTAGEVVGELVDRTVFDPEELTDES